MSFRISGTTFFIKFVVLEEFCWNRSYQAGGGGEGGEGAPFKQPTNPHSSVTRVELECELIPKLDILPVDQSQITPCLCEFFLKGCKRGSRQSPGSCRSCTLHAHHTNLASSHSNHVVLLGPSGKVCVFDIMQSSAEAPVDSWWTLFYKLRIILLMMLINTTRVEWMHKQFITTTRVLLHHWSLGMDK